MLQLGEKWAYRNVVDLGTGISELLNSSLILMSYAGAIDVLRRSKY
jgi:hypothetical protein